jgi:hypothetical protein
VINVPPRYSEDRAGRRQLHRLGLGKVPDAEFIHASYSGTLAGNNSANVRELVQHEAYADIFPGTRQLGREGPLDDDQRRRDVRGRRRRLDHRLRRRQASRWLRRRHRGRRPAQGRRGAQSDVIRQGVIDWFQNTLESRKNGPERTPIIVIMQRLHEKDLAGLAAG